MMKEWSSSFLKKFKLKNMNELIINREDGQCVTTSTIVAREFDKRHSDVLRDIRNLSCSRDFRERNFALMVKVKELPQGGGQKSEYYEMTKDGFSFLVMGYTGKKAAEFKEKFINAFNGMQSLLNSDDYILARSQAILKKRISVQKLRIEQLSEENEQQTKQLLLAAPKVQYVDTTLQSVNTLTTTQVAKEMGLDAHKLNKLLSEKGMLFRQSGMWMLTAKYQNNGYTKTRTQTYTRNDGSIGTSIYTVWTEKGRMFLHQTLKIKTPA
jgi:Rha family phage regulatory protein